MKNKQLILMLCVFILVLTGCMQGEDYEAYIAAVDKTEEVKSGRSRTEVLVESTFNQEVLRAYPPDEIKVFEKYLFTMEERFNRTADQSIIEIFYYNNTLGTDLYLYQVGKGKMYLKLPFINALYDVNAQVDMPSGNIGGFTKVVGEEWQRMLKVENIFMGEKTLIKNKDGEIKATKFTVKPTALQLDLFMTQLRLALIGHKAELVTLYQEMELGEGMTEALFETVVNALIDSITITGYEETAYVDVDGYVVEEKVVIDLSYASNTEVENFFETQRITIVNTLWEIERKQQLDFSTLDQLDILPIEKLTDWSVSP